MVDPKNKHSANKRSFIHFRVGTLVIGIIYGLLASRDNVVGLFLRKNIILSIIIVTILSGFYSVFYTLLIIKRKGNNLD